MIYLDNAATTWPKPEDVYEAVNACLRNVAGNPGRGSHNSVQSATGILYEAREALARLFKIDNPLAVVFTHNATDAINTALLGSLQQGDTVITTAMEHNAVARPLRYLESKGVQVVIIPCNHYGLPDMEVMERQMPSAKATIMSHASNVTGTIMPVRAVGELTSQYGVQFIVDAAQTAGVEEIDVVAMNIDMLAFSGHKGLLGPQGTGGLYIKEGIPIAPLRYGGTGSVSESDAQPDFLPDRLESGTPNTPGIAGLLAGIRFIESVGIDVIKKHETNLSQRLAEKLRSMDDITVYGPQEKQQRTSVVSFTVQDRDSNEIAHILDTHYHIACRAGLHCAPWAHATLGTRETGTVRFSPGYFNTENEIEEAIYAVQDIVEGNGKK